MTVPRIKASPDMQSGFSLLELMIVVAIIAIISAVAYPSYMQFVVDAKRTTATSVLMQVADRQQQFFMDNKRYTDDLTNLGFQASPLVINDEGKSVVSGHGDSIYSIAFPMLQRRLIRLPLRRKRLRLKGTRNVRVLQ